MTISTQALRALGQSLWIDNISRDMLSDGTLRRYIAELSVTGLTSNPTIFEHAISAGSAYDEQIEAVARLGKSGEDLFFALAVQDLQQAADLFRPMHEATGGMDGWVSLERRRHPHSLLRPARRLCLCPYALQEYDDVLPDPGTLVPLPGGE